MTSRSASALALGQCLLGRGEVAGGGSQACSQRAQRTGQLVALGAQALDVGFQFGQSPLLGRRRAAQAVPLGRQCARQPVAFAGQGLNFAREPRAFGLQLLALRGQGLGLFGERLLAFGERLLRRLQLRGGLALRLRPSRLQLGVQAGNRGLAALHILG